MLKPKAVWASVVLLIAIVVAASLYQPVLAQTTCTYEGFEATILQGTNAGLTLQGALELSADASGRLTGLLHVIDGRHLHVAGQVTGSLIGLMFDVRATADDPLTFVYGTGVILGDFADCHQGSIGGTLTGPAYDDMGTWSDPCYPRRGRPGLSEPPIICVPPPPPPPNPIPTIPSPFLNQ